MAECVDSPVEQLFQLISFLGVLANILLFLLVYHRTPKMMQNYRKVLYGSCTIDGMAATSHLLIRMRLLFVNDILVIDLTGPIPQGVYYMGWLRDGNMAYLFVVEAIFQYGVVCYCFVPYAYRYFHIIRSTTFTSAKFALLLLIYTSPAIVLSVSNGIFSALTYSDMLEYLGPTDQVECVTTLLIPFLDRRKYTKEPILTIATLAVHFLTPLLVFPILFIYFLIRIFKKLNDDIKQSSAVASRMQKQITITLSAQSIIPLIFVAIPTFRAYYTFALGGDKQTEIRMALNSMSLVALANPIATIILVKNYRNTIWNKICYDQFLASLTQYSSSPGPPSTTIYPIGSPTAKTYR